MRVAPPRNLRFCQLIRPQNSQNVVNVWKAGSPRPNNHTHTGVSFLQARRGLLSGSRGRVGRLQNYNVKLQQRKLPKTGGVSKGPNGPWGLEKHVAHQYSTKLAGIVGECFVLELAGIRGGGLAAGFL